MATVRITKIQVGQLTDTAVIDCVAPQVAAKLYLQDVDTGLQFPLQICFDPAASDPCHEPGFLAALLSAGYLIEDNPCGT